MSSTDYYRERNRRFPVQAFRLPGPEWQQALRAASTDAGLSVGAFIRDRLAPDLEQYLEATTSTALEGRIDDG